MNTIDKAVRDIEARTGVPAGFFDNLKAEDDWSFIIKSHALIEAACAELLTEYVGSMELLDPFSRLELSNKRSGKIAFLKSLNLLDEDERRFVSSLSELRNILVNNVRNTVFDLSVHISSLDKKQRKSFAKSFGYAFISEEDHPDFTSDINKVLNDPKDTLWRGLKFILAVISLQMDTLRAKRNSNNSLVQIGEAVASFSKARGKV
jgi:hypothetical protein